MNKLGLIELRNSSLTRPSRELEKSSFDRPLVLSHSDFLAQPTNLAQDTRIAYAKNIKIKSKNPYKSFCYFLLSQKVESPLPLNPNLPSEANLQNLAQKGVESSLDSTLSTQETNSSIFDEKSGLRSCERGNRTWRPLTKRTTSLPDLSQKDAEFVRLWV